MIISEDNKTNDFKHFKFKLVYVTSHEITHKFSDSIMISECC
jgi:hypothetical protein